jgi:shikimate kinase
MILKLKQTPGIYLVGFMGCGKSTIGRALADELGWSFFDLDEEIEKSTGKKIFEIFDQEGEASFRALESQELQKRVKSVRTGRPQVIALGGGAISNQENFELATNHGITIWLDVPVEVAQQRIAHETHRPLASDPERFRALYEARRDDYSRADYRIDADADPAVVVVRIQSYPLFVP